MAISRGIVAFVAVLGAVAAAGYWHWSPYLSMKSMQAAAKAGDADTFNRHVDYPRLRESLKGQFGALMAEKMGAVDSSRSGAAQTGAVLGLALGSALMDRMVDAMVRPETIMRAMERGKLQATQGARGDQAGDQAGERPEWRIQRDGFDRVIAYASSAADPGPGFVFERAGFATWRLSEIRLPLER